MKIGVVLGAVQVALGAFEAGLSTVPAFPYQSSIYAIIGLVIAMLGAVSAYLHAQGVDGASPQPQPPPPSS